MSICTLYRNPFARSIVIFCILYRHVFALDMESAVSLGARRTVARRERYPMAIMPQITQSLVLPRVLLPTGRPRSASGTIQPLPAAEGAIVGVS